MPFFLTEGVSHKFSLKKKKNDVIFAGVCTKQAYCLTSGEYDL